MAYCSLSDVKILELGIATGITGDDAIIALKILAAQAFIDAYTRRTFEAATATIRYYSIDDTDGRDLLLDTELAEAPTLVRTNLDGAAIVTVPSTDYVTLPRNKTPYYGLRLIGISPYYWRYSRDGNKAAEITGKFAYSTTAPDDIKQACIRLAGFFYRAKDASVYDVTASLETGQMVIPKGTPQDVVNILNNRRKPTL